MKIKFLGAVRTVTGSMHGLEINKKRILLDAGLVQGRRKEAFELNRQLAVNPKKIDRIILSHAHIDHSGNLPSLVKQGFRGEIFCTSATADLLNVMLRDCAHIMAKDVEYVNKRRKRQSKNLFEPLYALKDVEKTLKQIHEVPYREPSRVCKGVDVTFLDAGHILGAAQVLLDIDENGRKSKLGFSGDLGRKDLPILRDPDPMPPVDWLLCESTYGNRLHPPPEKMPEILAEAVKKTFSRGGVVVIPAFSVGRTQNLVYVFHELIRSGQLPEIPIFVDSPLSVNATEVFRRHPECFGEEALEMLRHHDDPLGLGRVTYIRDVEESRALNDRREPCVIISASGMCEAGRIQHHLKHRITDERNLIMIVGFQADHTLGKKIVLRVPYLKIFGKEHPLRAEVAVLNGFSAHADRNELIDFVQQCGSNARGIFLIHGAEDQCLAFQQHLEARRLKNVHVPHWGETLKLNGK